MENHSVQLTGAIRNLFWGWYGYMHMPADLVIGKNLIFSLTESPQKE
jgi:hypothetical protein